jgi:hypothetical protein
LAIADVHTSTVTTPPIRRTVAVRPANDLQHISNDRLGVLPDGFVRRSERMQVINEYRSQSPDGDMHMFWSIERQWLLIGWFHDEQLVSADSHRLAAEPALVEHILG